jgi:hypothetical protein
LKEKERSPLGWYTIGIAALFLAGFFLLVLFGALTYRNTVRSQRANYDARSLSAYLTTAIRANDSEGSFLVYDDGTYGQVISADDGNSGFAFRIYRCDGKLVEDYAETGAPLNPDAAQTIGETEVFSVRILTDNLCSVETDAGRSLIGLRSGIAGGDAQ